MLLQTQLLTPMLEPICLTQGLQRQQKAPSVSSVS